MSEKQRGCQGKYAYEREGPRLPPARHGYGHFKGRRPGDEAGRRELLPEIGFYTDRYGAGTQLVKIKIRPSISTC